MVPVWLTDLKNRMYADMNARTFVNKLQSPQTHVDMHVNQSTVDMLDRGFAKCPRLFAISSFDNAATMTTRIEEAFTNVLEHQPDFVRKTLSVDPRTTKSTEISIAFDDGYDDLFPTRSKGVALDIRGRIREYETNVTSLVLHPDERSPYGFTLLTMFPRITPVDNNETQHLTVAAHTRETGRDLTEDIQRTVFYRMSDPTRQAQLRLACDDFPECLDSLRYIAGHDNEPSSVSAALRGPSGQRYLVYVDEFGTTLRQKRRNAEGRSQNVRCDLTRPPSTRVDLSQPDARMRLRRIAPEVEAYVSRMEAEIQNRQMQFEKTMPPRRRLPNKTLMGRVDSPSYGFDF